MKNQRTGSFSLGHSAVRASVIAILASVSATSLALAADTSPVDELQEVMVTGSRLISSGFSTPTPVTQLNAATLEQLNVTNLGAAVSQLPAFKPSNTPTNNGWGSFNVGAQIVNLRGLGVNRNLVLVDNRRFAPVTREGTVDLNLIPSGLVERTDVVTGGASAAYGSDAVAGAVNIVLNKKLTGIKGQVDMGASEWGDGNNYHVSLAGGHDFAGGLGHFILGGEYDKQEGIGDCFTRSWCKGGQIVTNVGAGAIAGQPYLVRSDVGGGFQANTGGVINFINNGTASTAAIRGMFGNTGTTGGVTFNSAGTPIAYTLGTPAQGTNAIGGDVVSGMTTTQLMVPVERYTSYGHADYEFSDQLHGFVEGSYGHVAGSTLQSRYFGTALPIFTDNPYIPAAVRALIPGAPVATATPGVLRPGTTATTGTYGTGAFNLAVLGQRRGESASSADTARVTFGLDGKLKGSWTWDAYYQFANTDRHQEVANNLVTGATRVINKPGSGGANNADSLAYWYWATDAVYNPADAALPAAQRRIVCRASISTNAALAAAAAGCVPLNPFGEGQASQAALDYVYRTLTEEINIKQHVVAANVQGEVLDLWAGPLAVAAGLEYRRDSTALVHDALSNSFTYFQNFGADYNATQDVTEAYAEANLPLAKDKLFVQDASLNAAIRQTQYKFDGFGGFNQAAASNKFDATAWKVGLLWDVSDWLRLRATRSQDIRAPNFNELFQASASSFTAYANPWANNVSQFPSGLAGGNPALNPETAHTTTIGMVLQPKWNTAGRISLSADYYDIKVDGYIGAPGGQNIIDRCYKFNETAFCNLIGFATDASGNARGVLTEVRNANVNLQWLHTRGLDVEADYRVPLSAMVSDFVGELSLRALVSKTYESSTNLFGVVTNQVGATGTGAGVPDAIINLYATYTTGPFSATVSARYIPAGLYSATYIGPNDPAYGSFDNTKQQTINGVVISPINDNTVSSATYYNLNGSYNIHQEGSTKVQVFVSINNLLGTKPPMAPSTTYPTNPVYFDQIGRFMRAGVRFNF